MLKLDLTDPNPMLADYARRVEAGLASPIDRANAAAENAIQAADILCESERADIARAASEKVLRMASLAARLQAGERDEEAEAVAYAAEVEAAAIAELDPDRFDGLIRYSPLEAGHGKRAARLA